MKIDLLKKRIVWKVYFIWILKRVLPLFAAEILILILAVYLFGRFFFVGQIVSNTLVVTAKSPISIFNYFISSFIKTSLLNKGIVIVVLSFGVLILRDVGRILVSYVLTSRTVKPRA